MANANHTPKLCSVDGCDRNRNTIASGLCKTHLWRFNKYGSTDLPKKVVKLCSVDGCETKSKCKGLCTKHHTQWRRDQVTKLCDAPNCDLKATSNDAKYCQKHLAKIYRYGSIDSAPGTSVGEPLEWLKQIVNTSPLSDSCIEFKYTRDVQGYGAIGAFGKEKQKAHRVALALFMGLNELPDPKIECCHSCNNTSCVNPSHLRWDDHKGNMDDMAATGIQKGVMNPGSKLTENQVRSIRADQRHKNIIAKDHNIGPDHVLRIKRRARWGWLD